MNSYDIEKLSKNISQSEKNALGNITKSDIREHLAKVDLSQAAKKMRELNLGDAANKLDSMTNEDLINLISQNPQIIDKMKKIFK